MLGCDLQVSPEAFQAALIRAVEALKPPPEVPSTARSRRIYDLLVYRYVQNLTQDETAEYLGITPRHLRREQPEAVHVLAARLWEQSRARAPAAVGTPAPRESLAEGGATAPAPEWLSQIRQELVSLQRSAPGALAEVGPVMQRAVELAQNITTALGIAVRSERVAPDLVVAIHPTTLQQILIAAICQLAEQQMSEAITLSAVRGTGHIRITIAGQTKAACTLPDVPFIREVLGLQGGTAEVEYTADGVLLSLILPAVYRTVLLVDDNEDLVHVFRRYLVGTRYRIVHLSRGREALQTIEDATPDIVVLDVMLPDVDGWELLAKLHQHPATRAIPVVVCSVVREESLALALGATVYLPKPAQRDQFLDALDRAFSRAQAAAQTAQGSSASTC